VTRTIVETDRVIVFIDGQNQFKTCIERYGHGCCHPLLLAHILARGRTLQGVRYYSGVHDPHVNPELNAYVQRRHELMRKTGVTVVERALRYRWEWAHDARKLPDPRKHRGETLQVDVQPYKRAREKGIDLTLGLDVVELGLRGIMDVAIILSSDTDMTEVARVTHQMTRTKDSKCPVSVEAAVFNDQGSAVLLEHYRYTHQLRRNDFEEARDEFEYKAALDPVMVELFLRTVNP
jgi:uncharacterized LabA/DUF88 family protein